MAKDNNASKSESINEPTKEFYLRNIPESLHRRFKTMAAFTGKGMNGLAILSLDAYISALERKLPQFNPDLQEEENEERKG